MAIKTVVFDSKEFEIAYDLMNVGKDKSILFLHGWGSNKEVMKIAFADKFSDYTLLFVDMPGFGKSTNDYVLNTFDYAKIMKEFLLLLGIKPDIIFGHSFGGKVATLLNPKLLCLLSSAGIVEKKPFKVRAKIKIFKLLKKFFGDSMYALFATKDVSGMPKNMYETVKNVVNEDFTPYFESFDNRALIFWGKDDTATSVESGKKISLLIRNSKFYELDGDHYFFLKTSEKIAETLLSEAI